MWRNLTFGDFLWFWELAEGVIWIGYMSKYKCSHTIWTAVTLTLVWPYDFETRSRSLVCKHDSCSQTVFIVFILLMGYTYFLLAKILESTELGDLCDLKSRSRSLAYKPDKFWQTSDYFYIAQRNLKTWRFEFYLSRFRNILEFDPKNLDKKRNLAENMDKNWHIKIYIWHTWPLCLPEPPQASFENRRKYM